MPFLGLTAITWAAIAAITSTAMGVYSAVAQGQAQSRAAAHNALIARQNAALSAEQMGIAKKEKEITAARHMREAEKTLASQRALTSKAGFEMEGTPLYTAIETMAGADIDALAIRYAGTVEQSQLLAQQAGLKQQETLEKMRGKMFGMAGTIGAGQSLLTGVSKVSDLYSK